jgi:hypothetical protein
MLTVPNVERRWLEASGRAAAAVTATSLTNGDHYPAKVTPG